MFDRYAMPLIMVLLLVPVIALAEKASDAVMVHDAYVRAIPPGQPNSAAFMDLMNKSDVDQVLVSAESTSANAVELHTHIMDGGMMRMRQVEKIELPAGETVPLKPSGHHVMFIGVDHQFMPGEQIPLTLVFGDGSKKDLQVPVRKIQMMMKKGGDTGSMKHNH